MNVISSAQDIGNIIGYTNDDFYQFAKSADMVGDLLSQYKTHLESTAKSTSKFATVAKTAKTALGSIASFGLNMLGSMAISWAIT